MSPVDLTSQANHRHARGVVGYHHIEESVAVYLHASSEGAGWTVCDTATDGYALESNYDRGPLTESCECEDESTCKEWAARLAAEPLPDAEQLLHLLADALDYDLTPRTRR